MKIKRVARNGKASMRIDKRLKSCMDAGNLTMADLQRWFERPYPTVRSWSLGTSVSGGAQDIKDIEQRLHKLESKIKSGRGLLAAGLTRGARQKFLQSAKVE